MNQEKKVLLVIDVQNDYFPGGFLPLWHAEETLDAVLTAMAKAKARGIPVVLVQHVAKSGGAPFFNPGTDGVAIHPKVLAAAPDAPVVVKGHADAFVDTDLEAVLTGLGATHLLICGMMTHNCVTHTAISRAADKYRVSILGDCCATVSELMHAIALNAVATRGIVTTSAEALAD